ncbi:ATP phosphoribosyltransferase [Arthrobacter sp. MYb211]|uniref:ATP phosphoribosyltransferase n=1 Tax=Micrococcaceae TaxID=1268 RepID=UPI000BB978A8|nr:MULTISPECIES: ATP phosphoribosyltransferase [Micrococcaceae]PCC29377.1 ATP phosphoribosyltransferase [Glutamicibacter sp. BW80]PRA01387.1 ATP phosphoribosyltransferase [Arthrobacter sp. MYb224]PRA06421.1 ATP phosphoribosyltransferase [Arthrobacter sp. MYb229]PRA12648.1 ATP phosphoribosyltransferase [Arthrobacter sp. MYb221]PRB53323.1 ATP phosphoribosyltransferase [Arthrobacter sp. MYb216]
MLRVALPNKGALSEIASTMFKEAGYLQRRDTRELVLVDEENNVEFFYLRPRDIAVYVGRGILDVGITGRDLYLDADVDDDVEEQLSLGIGKSAFRFAAPVGAFNSVEELNGKRIATSYDILLDHYLKKQGIDASVVRLDGAVESSVRLGVADAIADVVETGNTIKAAGMEIFGDVLLQSEAVLIGRVGHKPAGLDLLIRRLSGVLVARQYVMLDYDIRRVQVEEACALTPGLESPTVSDLANSDWCAVRAMVKKSQTNNIMDELYDVGARAILVSQIHACRI